MSKRRNGRPSGSMRLSTRIGIGPNRSRLSIMEEIVLRIQAIMTRGEHVPPLSELVKGAEATLVLGEGGQEEISWPYGTSYRYPKKWKNAGVRLRIDGVLYGGIFPSGIFGSVLCGEADIVYENYRGTVKAVVPLKGNLLERLAWEIRGLVWEGGGRGGNKGRSWQAGVHASVSGIREFRARDKIGTELARRMGISPSTLKRHAERLGIGEQAGSSRLYSDADGVLIRASMARGRKP